MEILGLVFILLLILASLLVIFYMVIIIVKAIRSSESTEKKSQQKRKRCGFTKYIVRNPVPSGLVDFEMIRCEHCEFIFTRLSHSTQNNAKYCPFCGFEFLEQKEIKNGDWIVVEQ